VHVELASKVLSGEIPTDLWTMTQLLEVLSLYLNQLTGVFPYDLAQLTRLARLELGDYLHTGTSADLGRLSNLVSLYFSQVDCTGPFPNMSEWTNLGETEIVVSLLNTIVCKFNTWRRSDF
jgi:hypothetical protein